MENKEEKKQEEGVKDIMRTVENYLIMLEANLVLLGRLIREKLRESLEGGNGEKGNMCPYELFGSILKPLSSIFFISSQSQSNLPIIFPFVI